MHTLAGLAGDNAPVPFQAAPGDGVSSCELDLESLRAALGDPHANVRRSALRLAAERIPVRQKKQVNVAAPLALLHGDLFRMSTDPDAGVRFQLALAIGRCDDRRAAHALATLLDQDNSRWLQLAVLCGVGHDPWPLLRELLEDTDRARRHTVFLEHASEQFGLRASDGRLAESLGWLTADVDRSRSVGGLATLAGLSRGLFARGKSLSDLRLSAELLPKRVTDKIRDIVSSATAVAQNSDQAVEDRTRAIAVAVSGEPVAVDEWIRELAQPSQPQPVQSAAVWAAAQTDSPGAWHDLFDRWSSHTRATREAMLGEAFRSPAGVEALVVALETDILSADELPASTREILAQLHAESLRRRVQPILATAAPADRSEVVARYADVANRRGDSARGAGIFKQNCQSCHAVQGVGQQVGPDLASVASRRSEQLLVDILDPSRQVSPDYISYLLQTKDGRIMTGLIAAETADRVTLRREERQQDTIPRSSIEQLRASGKSLMPDGLEQKLTPDELADLLEFLHDPEGTRKGAGRSNG
jgi:putative heme-binding domain-containing protein